MSIVPREIRRTAADLPRVRQSLALVCVKCGAKHSYDVGTVFLKEEAKGNERFQFTNYFRCLHCDSPGPFEVADHLRVIAEILAGKVRGDPKVFLGRVQLFDGAAHQTVAMFRRYGHCFGGIVNRRRQRRWNDILTITWTYSTASSISPW